MLDHLVFLLMSALFLSGIGLYAFRVFSKGLSKEMKRLLMRYSEFLFSAGLSGLVLYVFSWQQIPILSMRFLYLVWLAGFGFWKVTILRYHFKDLPQRRAARAERMEYEKWLPKKKKK